MASPTQILGRAVELVQDGTLGSAILVSLKRVGLGLAIGATVGLVLALGAGLSRIGEDAIDPPMQMLRTLPFLGLIPLFIIWMGIGETPKIALIALGVAFPLYLNTLAGIRGIDRRTTEAARAMHLTLGPADPARGAARGDAPDADRPAPEPRHRLAGAHRRRDRLAPARASAT